MIEQINQVIKNLDYSEFDNKKICLMITTYNRPFYLEKVISSINECDELRNIPIFIFLDGGSGATIRENIEIVKNIKHNYKFIIKRESNYGPERSIPLSLKFLYDNLDFEYVFVIEDDLVVQKNYFRYVFEQYNKIKKIDSKIGTFQGWNKCLMSIDEKKINKDITVDSIDEHFWGYLMHKDTYSDIRSMLEEYLKCLDGMPYDSRWKTYRDIYLKDKISNFYKELLKNYKKNDFIDRFKIEFVDFMFSKFNNNNVILGHDGALDIFLFLNGYKRYFSLVNRAICIGEIGLHQTPELWRQLELGLVRLDNI